MQILHAGSPKYISKTMLRQTWNSGDRRKTDIDHPGDTPVSEEADDLFRRPALVAHCRDIDALKSPHPVIMPASGPSLRARGEHVATPKGRRTGHEA